MLFVREISSESEREGKKSESFKFMKQMVGWLDGLCTQIQAYNHTREKE